MWQPTTSSTREMYCTGLQCGSPLPPPPAVPGRCTVRDYNLAAHYLHLQQYQGDVLYGTTMWQPTTSSTREMYCTGLQCGSPLPTVPGRCTVRDYNVAAHYLQYQGDVLYGTTMWQPTTSSTREMYCTGLQCGSPLPPVPGRCTVRDYNVAAHYLHLQQYHGDVLYRTTMWQPTTSTSSSTREMYCRGLQCGSQLPPVPGICTVRDYNVAAHYLYLQRYQGDVLYRTTIWQPTTSTSSSTREMYCTGLQCGSPLPPVPGRCTVQDYNVAAHYLQYQGDVLYRTTMWQPTTSSTREMYCTGLQCGSPLPPVPGRCTVRDYNVAAHYLQYQGDVLYRTTMWQPTTSSTREMYCTGLQCGSPLPPPPAVPGRCTVQDYNVAAHYLHLQQYQGDVLYGTTMWQPTTSTSSSTREMYCTGLQCGSPLPPPPAVPGRCTVQDYNVAAHYLQYQGDVLYRTTMWQPTTSTSSSTREMYCTGLQCGSPLPPPPAVPGRSTVQDYNVAAHYLHLQQRSTTQSDRPVRHTS